MAVRTLANGNPPRYAGAASPRKRRNTCPTTQRRFGMCGFWRAPADPGCPLSRRVLEGKRTCHGDRESDVHDPGRVKTRVFAVNTRILEKCILQLDAVSASSAAVSDSLRKHFRFGCSAHAVFTHGVIPGSSHTQAQGKLSRDRRGSPHGALQSWRLQWSEPLRVCRSSNS
jgi:hypothetical protein